MTTARDLTPEDAPALTELYEDYDWWADREVEAVREALAETEVAVGVFEAVSASDASSAERSRGKSEISRPSGDDISRDSADSRVARDAERPSDRTSGESREQTAEPRDDGDEPRAEDGGDLVAAARVLTDFTYYATVFDVIVAADRRGEGLGKVLLNAVLDHPDLESVAGLSLLCRRGLVPFYESVGFEVFDREIEVPEGGTEELVRMIYDRDE